MYGARFYHAHFADRNNSLGTNKLPEAANSVISEVNARFSEKSWLDFVVVSLQDSKLKIKASSDFCYYHECEIEFSGVRYIHGPAAWGSNLSDGLIRLSPENEVNNLINLYKLEPPCHAFIFDTDESFKVTIVAESIQVNFDTVYYYARENLGVNERIAEGVILSPP